MMKKILMSVYAACALLVIIGSLLWFVFTLNSDSAAGKTEALKRFKVFAQHTGEILSESAQENDYTRLQIRLEQLCRNYSKYVQSVVMRDSAGIVFIWPQNTDFFSYNEQYVVEVKNLPLFFTAAQIHIPIKETGNTVTVHAALQTLPMETIFNRGQIVFFLLLLIVLMTVMVLVFSYIDLKPAQKKWVLKNEPHVSETAVTDSEITRADYTAEEHEMENTVEPDSIPQTGAAAAPQEEQTDISETQSSPHQEPAAEENGTKTHEPSPLPLNVQLESLNRLHIYDDEREKRTETESQNESGIAKEPSTPAAGNERNLDAENYGFFENHTQTLKPETKETEKQASVTTFENTPLTDTAHGDNHSLEQATLIEELTTAITETAVAEEDLTLMLIHATDLPHNQQIIHLLRSTLDRIHKIFIFNKDILGVMIFYAPLDQAMQIASTLYDEIHTLLDDSVKQTLGIGLTTRAGRLIPAPRMIEEATAAIGKAIQEGSDPIVAFRVNPDQYRRCLARLS
jgi:hypothetical protein